MEEEQGTGIVDGNSRGRDAPSQIAVEKGGERLEGLFGSGDHASGRREYRLEHTFLKRIKLGNSKMARFQLHRREAAVLHPLRVRIESLLHRRLQRLEVTLT